jgi:hypothetical protein
MAQELGRLEKPLADDYRAGRKLLFVPLILVPVQPPVELKERLDRYWQQVEDHVSTLESKLGSVTRVYHELVPVGGDEGAKAIEQLSGLVYGVVKARLERGATVEPVEDGELLAEFMDWGRCLSLGLQSQTAFGHVYQLYSEAQKKREEHIAKQIDTSLPAAEMGILFLREGHGVQFPSDIRVFYVAPPALEDLKHWLRDHPLQSGNED